MSRVHLRARLKYDSVYFLANTLAKILTFKEGYNRHNSHIIISLALEYFMTMFKKIVRYIFLGFYTLGFFVVLGLGSLILVSITENNVNSLRLNNLPDPDEWYLYTNANIGVTIWYPQEWSGNEFRYPSGSDIQLLTFSSPDFQTNENGLSQGINLEILGIKGQSGEQSSTSEGDGDQSNSIYELDSRTVLEIDEGLEAIRYQYSAPRNNRAGQIVLEVNSGEYQILFTCEFIQSQPRRAREICNIMLRSIEFI